MPPPRTASPAPGPSHRALPGIGAAAALAALFSLAAAPASTPAPAPGGPAPRALVVVSTLVMDALGTRTVDTDRARIPFGGRGLLIKQVPYAGPPLSFRLAVLAGPPQEAGIPLTLSAEIWNGEPGSPPPADQVSRREEATVLSPEGSYLLELDHDAKAGRRIVLSLTARPSGPQDEEIPFPLAAPGPPVRFALEVMREAGGQADPPDQRVMSALAGQPITYSSGVRLPGRPGESGESADRLVGLSVTLEAEQVQGNLVSVRLEMTGAEFTDTQHTRLEPFRHQSIHTVPSGTPFETALSVPAEPPSPPGEGTVIVHYLVRVTPFVGP